MRKLQFFAIMIVFMVSVFSAVSCGESSERSENSSKRTTVRIDEIKGFHSGPAEVQLISTERGQYDYCQNYNHFGSSMCSADQAVYFITKANRDEHSRLYFYDKASGAAAPLCGKAECQHDDESCNAFLGTNRARGLCNYDNKLYFVFDELSSDGDIYYGTYVYSMNYDGTGRSRQRAIIAPAEDEPFPYNSTHYYFHRDFLIVAGFSYSVLDGESVFDCEVRAYPLSWKTGYITVFKERLEQGAVGRVYCFLNEYELYFSFSRYKCFDNENGETEYTPSENSIYRWNLETKELECLFRFETQNPIDEFIRVTDGFLISTWGRIDKLTDEGEWTGFCDISEAGYYGIELSEDYITGYTYPFLPDDYSKRSRFVMNYEKEVLFSITEKEEFIDKGSWFGRLCYGVDDDFVYYMYDDMAGGYCMAGLPLQKRKTKIIWENSELIN